VPGLFAVGEAARTGLHGGNRLASNSLLEGLVLGERVAEAAHATVLTAEVFLPRRPELVLTAAPVGDPQQRATLQAAMSATAGIGREAAGLTATAALAERAGTAPTSPRGSLIAARVEAANLALASRAVLAAALARRESRGCHVRTDHPDLRPELARSAVVRAGADGSLAVTPIAAPMAGAATAAATVGGAR
jgi:L-aspartate oxidase